MLVPRHKIVRHGADSSDEQSGNSYRTLPIVLLRLLERHLGLRIGRLSVLKPSLELESWLN